MQADIPTQDLRGSMETSSEPRSTTDNDKAPLSSGLEIPNGGFTAWLQVAGSFFIFFNTW